MKAFFVVVALLTAAFIWFGGIRIIVIQPIRALPKGVTVIVAGIPGAHLVDSPDALCARREGGVSLLCRDMTARAIAKQGTILLRLPYSETLFRFTGGPYRDD
jgi:hypothetical protein